MRIIVAFESFPERIVNGAHHSLSLLKLANEMCVCVYVCMYVCMYVCIYTYMCVSVCLWCVCVLESKTKI